MLKFHNFPKLMKLDDDYVDEIGVELDDPFDMYFTKLQQKIKTEQFWIILVSIFTSLQFNNFLNDVDLQA